MWIWLLNEPQLGETDSPNSGYGYGTKSNFQIPVYSHNI